MDLQVTDQQGAKSFDGRLYGWRFDHTLIPTDGSAERPDRLVRYSMAFKGDGVVAAIGSQTPEQAAQVLSTSVLSG